MYSVSSNALYLQKPTVFSTCFFWRRKQDVIFFAQYHWFDTSNKKDYVILRKKWTDDRAKYCSMWIFGSVYESYCYYCENNFNCLQRKACGLQPLNNHAAWSPNNTRLYCWNRPYLTKRIDQGTATDFFYIWALQSILTVRFVRFTWYVGVHQSDFILFTQNADHSCS